MDESCETCRFWKFVSDDGFGEGNGWGECRRDPPTIVYDENTVESRNPRTFLGDWCGEYQAKTVTKEEGSLPGEFQEFVEAVREDMKRRKESKAAGCSAVELRKAFMAGRNWTINTMEESIGGKYPDHADSMDESERRYPD